MCSPEETLIGRALTLARVQELNAKTYFYSMLKDNPALASIRPGVEDELLVGAIDPHIHAYPDFVPRAQDMLEIAVDAARAGMRAVVFKDHWHLSAGAAYFVQKAIDEMVGDGRLAHRVEVYGGLGLNLGIDPRAVEVALRYPNFRCIWFPTFRSLGWARTAGLEDTGDYIRLVAPSGEVLPEVRTVMEIAAEAGIGIGLGHTDYEELLPLATLARDLGVRTVLDHPLLELNRLTLEEIVTLADLGCFVGTYCQPMIPSLYQPVADPMATVEVLTVVGGDRCVAGSDFGQVLHVKTVDGLRIFIRALLGFGVDRVHISAALRDTPARLLGLPPVEE